MEQDTFFQSASFEDILDDLSCRFIVNIPSEELVSVPRICFQVEQAHWFYEDFVREQNPRRLPSLSLRKFSKCIFDHCPLLWQYSGSHEEEFEDFLRYKQRVPVLGGILLDENWEKLGKEAVGLFQEGRLIKMNRIQIVLFVYEETGFDISPLILPDAFLELQIKEQRVKLYIIPGVPTNTPMSPQTRKEISMIGWIRLVDLPGYSNRNKQTHPGIKLYMVTPFISGLRKWIKQNHHRKGKLVPLEEDILEDVIQDEVVQNGTTNDLIAMLRRQQQPPSTNQEVDLLGMLRNGSRPQYPTPPAQEHYCPPSPPSNDLLYTFQGSPTQSSNLLQFSPPVRDTIQEPPRPVELQPPMLHQNFPDARRNSLLGILKGGPNLGSESNVVNPSILDILKGSQSPPVDTTQQRQVVESANVDHQRSLLTALKRPQLSSTMLTTSNKPPTVHQTALLSALKSPPISHATPPPSQSPKTTPATSAHQSALLATLKLPPKPTPPPSRQSEVPPMKGADEDSATTSNHQQALLAALTSPKVQPSTPPTNNQSPLLTALKSPPIQSASPEPVTNGQPANSQTVPDGSIEIPARPTVASLLLRVKSPPVPRTTPSPAYHSPLLSALKSPTLPPQSSSTQHQSSLLNTLKGQPIVQGQIPSAFENPKPQSPMENQREGPVNEETEDKNAHVESLLRTLKSPSTSPVVKNVVPESHTDEPTEGGVTSDVAVTEIAAIMSLKKSNTKGVSNIKTPPVSNHVSSLLSSLKGSSAPNSTPSTKSEIPTAQNSLLSALTSGKSNTPEASVRRERSPEVISAMSNQVTSATIRTSPLSGTAQDHPPPASTKPLLDALKGTRPNGTPPSNFSSPAATSHQKSLLSLLNPLTRQSPPPSSKPESKPSSSLKDQQFNFSPTPQIGKRIKFREILVPGGKIEVTPEPLLTEPKSNGTIDLSKMTLLKRPPPKEKSLTSENTPTMDDKPTIPTETKRPVTNTMPSKSSTENKPESPLGIEFPFRRRTPSKNSRASPTTTPPKANAQSLLALLKASTPEGTKECSDVPPDQSGTKDEQIKSLLDVLKPTPMESGEPTAAMEETKHGVEPEASVPTAEPEEVESLGTEREMKLIAMLERALARGVPS